MPGCIVCFVSVLIVMVVFFVECVIDQCTLLDCSCSGLEADPAKMQLSVMYELEYDDGYGGKAVKIVTYNHANLVCNNIHSLTTIAISTLQLIHDRQLHFGWNNCRPTSSCMSNPKVYIDLSHIVQKHNHDSQNKIKTYNTTLHDNISGSRGSFRDSLMC